MKLTFEQWLGKQDISHISPEAYYAEEAWDALASSIEIEIPSASTPRGMEYVNAIARHIAAQGFKVKIYGR